LQVIHERFDEERGFIENRGFAEREDTHEAKVAASRVMDVAIHEDEYA